MTRLSKTVLTSGSYFGKLVKGLDDELETSQAATTKAKKVVEQQKRLVSVSEKSNNNSLNDVFRSCGREAVAGTGEEELLSNSSGTPGRIAGATAE